MAFRTLALLGLVALGGSACTSSGAPQSRPQQMVEDRDIRNESQTVTNEVSGSVQETWDALVAVYEELDLQVTAADPNGWVLAARQNRMSRLGGQRNSNWVDCGSDLTGEVADKSFITFDVVSRLTGKSANSTELQSPLQARGRRRDNASGEMLCSTEGRLEIEIQERVAARLAGG